MNLLRSLISVQLQDVNEEFSQEKHESNTKFQSAKQLTIRPKQSNKSKLFACSCVNLSTHKPIQPELQLEGQEEEELKFNVADYSEPITNLKITLPSNFDLNALQDDDSHIKSQSVISHNELILTDPTENNLTYTENYSDLQNDIYIFPNDEFKFMYKIGHGTFGVVHKYFHMPSCQIVAIKKFRSANSESIETFKNEIKICEKFSKCKFLVNMIEYGLIKQENKLCIALEYMNMSSLNKNKFIFSNDTINRIKYVCFCVLNALKCLHSYGYIHNDIKPANILFNDNCDVKLSDFGCVQKMTDINIPLTKSIGTEYYQSYEKRFISPVEYTTKTDIYSFGITICELLSQKQICQNILKPFEIPKEIMQKYGQTNSDLIDFLNKCLDRNYETRFGALQLLNHVFLKDSQNVSLKNIEKIEDIDDLEFMTSTLIGYYARYEDNIHENDKHITSNAPMTPIDNIWSDAKRIQNMAEASGFSESFVQDFVSRNVSNVKNTLLKF